MSVLLAPFFFTFSAQKMILKSAEISGLLAQKIILKNDEICVLLVTFFGAENAFKKRRNKRSYCQAAKLLLQAAQF